MTDEVEFPDESDDYFSAKRKFFVMPQKDRDAAREVLEEWLDALDDAEAEMEFAVEH